MGIWSNGQLAMGQWCNGVMGSCAMVQLCNGAMGQWVNGAMEQWAMVQWGNG